MQVEVCVLSFLSFQLDNETFSRNGESGQLDNENTQLDGAKIIDLDRVFLGGGQFQQTFQGTE